MKKLFFAVLSMFIFTSLMSQLTDADTALMAKAINRFRKDQNKNYLLVDKTYLVEYREFHQFSGAATNQIDVLKTNLSNKTKSELKSASSHFSQVDIPTLYKAIPVKIYSPVLNFLLNSQIQMSETETRGKKPEIVYAEQIKYYEDAYELDNLQAFHLSEPYYDSAKNYSVIILTIFRPKVADTYLLLFMKQNDQWRIAESKLAKTFTFDN